MVSTYKVIVISHGFVGIEKCSLAHTGWKTMSSEIPADPVRSCQWQAQWTNSRLGSHTGTEESRNVRLLLLTSNHRRRHFCLFFLSLNVEGACFAIEIKRRRIANEFNGISKLACQGAFGKMSRTGQGLWCAVRKKGSGLGRRGSKIVMMLCCGLGGKMHSLHDLEKKFRSKKSELIAVGRGQRHLIGPAAPRSTP